MRDDTTNSGQRFTSQLDVRREQCDRYREYASLRLDDQLSAFEGALLDHHLERCPSCEAFMADTAANTELLRTADLEPVLLQLAMQAPHRNYRVAGTASAAFAALATAAAVYALTSLGVHNQPSAAVADSTRLPEAYLAYPTVHKSIQIPRIRSVPASLLDGPVRGVHGIAAATGLPTV